jgi:3'-phosphoadenosine 5'-phosphosulfate sulfotransferase (PAPS reductase)/FAD synthetase
MDLETECLPCDCSYYYGYQVRQMAREMRNPCTILCEILMESLVTLSIYGKIRLKRTIKEITCKFVDLIRLAQDRYH